MAEDHATGEDRTTTSQLPAQENPKKRARDADEHEATSGHDDGYGMTSEQVDLEYEALQRDLVEIPDDQEPKRPKLDASPVRRESAASHAHGSVPNVDESRPHQRSDDKGKDQIAALQLPDLHYPADVVEALRLTNGPSHLLSEHGMRTAPFWEQQQAIEHLEKHGYSTSEIVRAQLLYKRYGGHPDRFFAVLHPHMFVRVMDCHGASKASGPRFGSYVAKLKPFYIVSISEWSAHGYFCYTKNDTPWEKLSQWHQETYFVLTNEYDGVYDQKLGAN